MQLYRKSGLLLASFAMVMVASMFTSIAVFAVENNCQDISGSYDTGRKLGRLLDDDGVENRRWIVTYKQTGCDRIESVSYRVKKSCSGFVYCGDYKTIEETPPPAIYFDLWGKLDGSLLLPLEHPIHYYATPQGIRAETEDFYHIEEKIEGKRRCRVRKFSFSKAGDALVLKRYYACEDGSKGVLTKKLPPVNLDKVFREWLLGKP